MKNKIIVFYFLVFSVVLYLFINNGYKNISFNNSNEEFVTDVLQSSSYHFVSNDDNILDNFISKVSNIDVNQPVSIIDKVFAYNDNTYIENIQQFSYVQNIVIDKPRVYIYNTHPLEGYTNTDFNVVMASIMLQEKLNSYGIQTLVEQRDAGKYIKENGMTNNYSATEQFLKDALNKYDSFDLVIDLHRDSVPTSVSTSTKINGKSYAKVMFVMNVNYPNYNIAKEINTILSTKYPTISRGMYDKYDDALNQELYPKIVLIELGSKFNTYDEVVNSIDALSISIKELLNER